MLKISPDCPMRLIDEPAAAPVSKPEAVAAADDIFGEDTGVLTLFVSLYHIADVPLAGPVTPASSTKPKKIKKKKKKSSAPLTKADLDDLFG